MRKSWNVVDYDYTKTQAKIDYSEVVTEPGLVLSMREIYQRYAAQGIDLLSPELVPDDEDPDTTEFIDADDDLDVLQYASSVRSRQALAEHSARRAKKGSKEEPSKTEDSKPKEEPKQSEGDD